MDNLERRIENIESRNRSVELDKAWETSSTRKILIVIFTYLVIGLFMTAIAAAKPWINAIVPATGFILSTLGMPLFKKIWINIISAKK